MRLLNRNRKHLIAYVLTFAVVLLACTTLFAIQKAHAWGNSKNGIEFYVLKVDEDNKPVIGATFSFDANYTDGRPYTLDVGSFPAYAEDGRVVYRDGSNDLITEWTTNNENLGGGYFTAQGGDEAKLVISETVVPDGYEKAEDTVIVYKETNDSYCWRVSLNGEPYVTLEIPTITIVNPLKKHEVKIAKRNEAGELLAGAELEITGTKFNGVALETQKITDTNQLRTLNLPAGEYVLKETKVPKGYLKADDINFKVDHDGNVTVDGKQVGEVVMTDTKEKTPKLSVKKTSNVTKAKPGDVIPYVITVKNTGDGDADDIVVLDTMGNNLTYVSDDSNGVHDGQKVSWNVKVAAGETKTINIKCRINEDAAGKIINNVEITNVKEEYLEPSGEEDSFVLGIYDEDEDSESKGAETGDKSYTWLIVVFALAAAGVAYMFKKRMKM